MCFNSAVGMSGLSTCAALGCFVFLGNGTLYMEPEWQPGADTCQWGERRDRFVFRHRAACTLVMSLITSVCRNTVSLNTKHTTISVYVQHILCSLWAQIRRQPMSVKCCVAIVVHLL